MFNYLTYKWVNRGSTMSSSPRLSNSLLHRHYCIGMLTHCLRLWHCFPAQHLDSRRKNGSVVVTFFSFFFFREDKCFLEACSPITYRLPISYWSEQCHTFPLVWEGTGKELCGFFTSIADMSKEMLS